MSHRCDHCGKLRDNVRLRVKTDPRTFKPIRVPLCTVCARKGGWADENHDRGRFTGLAMRSDA